MWLQIIWFKSSIHEKYLLRESFKDGYLPNEVLYRKKEAFSDGVSSKDKTWKDVLEEYIKNKYYSEIETFEELPNLNQYEHNKPISFESYYYREKYISYFGNTDTIIPYFWMPNWCENVNDPSARILTVYDEKQNL